MVKPSILHYSHHSVGLGHLVRSLAVAEGLSGEFHVVLCSGGPVPAGLRLPDAVDVVCLPPIGAGPDGRLSSLDPSLSLEQAWDERRARLLSLYRGLAPAAIVVELFPFGRAKFGRELAPLLEEARRDPRGVPVISSVRDLLVTAKREQQAHDDLAAERLRRYFDAVIVHADKRFARLEETFQPSTPLDIPVLYSGFVAPSTGRPARRTRTPAEVVVSAGGGRSAPPLLRAAAEAHRRVLASHGFRTRLVTGPFLPSEALEPLERAAARDSMLTLDRFIPDLATELAGATVSVSRGGYNTTVDLLRSGVRAVVVPHDGPGENEQSERARRLERLGALTVLPAEELNPGRLSEAVLAAAFSKPPVTPASLALDGAARTAALIEALIDRTRAPRALRSSGRLGQSRLAGVASSRAR